MQSSDQTSMSEARPAEIEVIQQARFQDHFDLNRLLNLDCAVIGVGAIGRHVAMGLAQMGIRRLSIFDPDMVDVTNIGSQGYAHSDVGVAKVDALTPHLIARAPNMMIEAIPEPFEKEELSASVLFLCADDMDVRRSAVESNPKADLIVDTRMAAHTGRLIAMAPYDLDWYMERWYPNDAASVEPCSSRTTPYCPMILAAHALHAIRHWMALPEVRMDFQIDLNIPAIFPTPKGGPV